MYKTEYVGQRIRGRSPKRWRESVQELMNKRGLNLREAERLVHDRNAWRGYVRGNAWGAGNAAPGMNPRP